MDESWKGHKISVRYTTGHYWDVTRDAADGAWSLRFERKPFDSPQEKGFAATMLQDWWNAPILYGAFAGEELIGIIEAATEWNNRLRVTELWVSEAHRYGGIGKLLMAQAESVARSRGHRALILETQSCNDPAVRFYLSCGFALAGCDLLAYSNDDLARHEVRLELGKLLE